MRGEVKAAKRRRCEFVQQICSLEVQFELRTTELKADGWSADGHLQMIHLQTIKPKLKMKEGWIHPC